MTSAPVWTSEEDAVLFRHVGEKRKVFARILPNRSMWAINSRIRKIGLSGIARSLRKARFARLWANPSKSIRDIATELGIDAGSVPGIARKRGLGLASERRRAA